MVSPKYVFVDFELRYSYVICRANQWTGCYMIGTSIMKELTDTSALPLALPK